MGQYFSKCAQQEILYKNISQLEINQTGNSFETRKKQHKTSNKDFENQNDLIYFLQNLSQTKGQQNQTKKLFNINKSPQGLYLKYSDKKLQIKKQNMFIRRFQQSAFQQLINLAQDQLKQIKVLILIGCQINSKMFQTFVSQMLPLMTNLQFVSLRRNKLQYIKASTLTLLGLLSENCLSFIDFGNGYIDGNPLQQKSIKRLSRFQRGHLNIVMNF